MRGFARFSIICTIKNREKNPWRTVTLSKVTLLHWCFSGFLNCANCAKSRKVSHMCIVFAEISL